MSSGVGYSESIATSIGTDCGKFMELLSLLATKVFSLIMLCGSETWTLNAENLHRLEKKKMKLACSYGYSVTVCMNGRIQIS